MSYEEGARQSRVLVTDGGDRAMLAEMRALADAGHIVDVAGFGPLTPSQWSRDCHESIRVRDPRRDAAGYIADLVAQVQRRRYDLLVPGGDYSLLALSAYRDTLEPRVRLGLPPHDVVVRCLDRDAFYEAARSAGLGPAPYVHCVDLSQARSEARHLGYPVFVRSARTSSVDEARVAAGSKTMRVADEASLAAAVALCRGDFLLQGAARGETWSFGGVIADGQLIAACLSRYLRTWPPIDGNAAASITLPIPASVESAIIRTLAALNWQGMFEIELIRAPDGRIVPIDLNPRAYGSMALATAAGVNLPAHFLAWVQGEALATARARPGVRYRWEDGDLRAIAWLLRRGRPADALAALRPRRDTTHAYFRREDPNPLVARVLGIAHGRLGAALGRRPAEG